MSIHENWYRSMLCRKILDNFTNSYIRMKRKKYMKALELRLIGINEPFKLGGKCSHNHCHSFGNVFLHFKEITSGYEFESIFNVLITRRGIRDAANYFNVWEMFVVWINEKR